MYAHIFKAAFTYEKLIGKLPLPSYLSEMTSVAFKVAKKVILFASGKRKSLHKLSRHGFEGNGAMKLSMSDQQFLLGLYDRDPARPLYSYVNKLYKFSGTKVCKGTIYKWFKYSFNFKFTCRKPSIFPAQKFSAANITKLIEYVKFVSYFDHKKFVFTNKKPMKGIDIFKKIRRSPLDGTVPFVIEAGFDTHNIYNLMAAKKINENENSCCVSSW